MRDWLKSKAGWLWVLLPLALPNCVLDREGTGPPATPNVVTVFDPGSPPYTQALFCDIRKISEAPHCATADELLIGVPLAEAAIALVKGQGNETSVGLDFSPEATGPLSCPSGVPAAIIFHGGFPVGSHACLNCGSQIPAKYADVTAACKAICVDLNGAGSEGFCADDKNARAATNIDGCFDNACSNNGALNDGFADPRRDPEPVSWTNQVGTSSSSDGTLTRTAAQTGNFDAGASSVQIIEHDDGYAEFEASETDKARVFGLSTGASDNDPSLADMDFAVRLSTDGHVFIFEGGSLVPGPNPDTSFATYASGDRLRVRAKDKFDGTAEIVYSLIPASCADAGCEGDELYTSLNTGSYPFRVDASLRELGATLTNARIVRIK